MKNIKIIIAILFAVLAILALLLNQKEEKVNVKPVVSVSTFSLYDITKHIANGTVKIVNILPFGVDPHSFEPTPKLMASIEKSRVVFYSGAGLEPWIENMTFKNRAIDMSKHVSLRSLHNNEFEHHKHHDEHCAHNTVDPHYWLDLDNMKKLTLLITDELIAIEEKNRDIYIVNRDKYIEKLNKLEKSYSEGLASCAIDTVVINHNSISYLADKYNFHSESLSGLSPEADPTASDIKRILHEIEEDGVSTIFYENFVSNKAMQTIAKDTGINVDVFHSLGNITADEADVNATYEEIMYINLQKLSKALMCK